MKLSTLYHASWRVDWGWCKAAGEGSTLTTWLCGILSGLGLVIQTAKTSCSHDPVGSVRCRINKSITHTRPRPKTQIPTQSCHRPYRALNTVATASEGKNEGKKAAIICILAVSKTPALTFPTSVFIKKVRTAPVYASFPRSFLMAVLLGLALVVLYIWTLHPFHSVSSLSASLRMSLFLCALASFRSPLA